MLSVQIVIALLFATSTYSFNVGVKNTKCNLETQNDVCKSLYQAICVNNYCKCPTGTVEDITGCVKGKGPSKTNSDFEELPFDYLPGGSTPKPKPTTRRTTTTTVRPVNPYPQQPRRPQQPSQPGGYQPGYNQPGNYPNNNIYGRQQPEYYDSNVAEKAGGGVGGGIGILVLLGLVYFCCCKGEKGKNLLSKLPFGPRSTSVQQPDANYQMQPQQPYSQNPTQVYVPPQQPGV